AIPPGPPMITSVTPAKSPCGTGTTITIAGANFRSVSRVELETFSLTVPLSTFTVNSTSLITATVPNNLRGGVYEAVVYTASGSSVQPVSSARTDLFSVSPTVSSLTPSTGPPSGATQVTVNGSCFDQGSQFRFGTAQASVVQCANSTQCIVSSPASGAATSVDVIANTAGAVSTPVTADLFTYAGPQITSVSPASGPVTGGTSVVIRGSGFPRYDARVFSLHPPLTMTFGNT